MHTRKKEFKFQREFYELQIKEWYESSKRGLEKEYEMQTKQQNGISEWLINEINARTILYEDHIRRINQRRNSKTILNEIGPEDITGTFTVYGDSPGIIPGHKGVRFFGEADIRPDGETFKLSWKMYSANPEQKLAGRGILLGNVFSAIWAIFYPPKFNHLTGLAVYTIFGNSFIRGTFAIIDSNLVGTEELRKTGE